MIHAKCKRNTPKFGSKQGRFIATIPNFGSSKEDYTYIYILKHSMKPYVLDDKEYTNEDDEESDGKQQCDNVSFAS